MELYVVNKFGNAFKARFIEVNDEGKATDIVYWSDDDIRFIDFNYQFKRFRKILVAHSSSYLFYHSPRSFVGCTDFSLGL